MARVEIYISNWKYPLFILYVILMSAGFFAFILSITSIDMNNIKAAFSEKLPVKFLGGFQIFFAVAIGMLWLKRILPTIADGSTPEGLDHYTTLVIQGMDLGFIVPVAFLSGLLLLKKENLGYLLSSVVIIKGFTLGAAISAMIINQFLAGVAMSAIEVVVFPLFSLLILICLIILLKNCKE